MKSEFDNYKLKTSLAEKCTSSTFCLAKWYHSNIYLQTGETHSCYHPAPHAIDTEAIKQNPSALHNTQHKINERKEMLAGMQTSGCKYCWNIENLNKNLISDRHIRTGSLYSEKRMNEILENPVGFNVQPNYIEVSFSNRCNFKCGYCHPKSSSRFLNEIKIFGPYSQTKNHSCGIDHIQIYSEHNNPYLDGWWKWWPELSKTLDILRITGGEPLIQDSTFTMLDYLKKYPSPQLELNINSNLGASEPIIKKFVERINFLIAENKIKKFKLFSSVDTWGSQAEYIRTGLSLALFEKNVLYYLEKTNQPLTFMITFNIFSIPHFSALLEKILNWRKLFPGHEKIEGYHRVRFDISYLKEPLQYDINILPKSEFMPYMDQHLQYIKNNLIDGDMGAFSEMEYQKFLRIHEYMGHTIYSNEKMIEGRKDFYHFFSELDRRRNCSLLKNFPELNSFWKDCENLANIQV